MSSLHLATYLDNGEELAVLARERVAEIAGCDGRRCLFFRGLDMGRTDEGSHPGGAKKLLTARDHANGQSVDQVLAHTLGQQAPHRHVYLGVQANADGASGDKHISYVGAQQPAPPEDNPLRAFDRLFGGAGQVGMGGAGGGEMNGGDGGARPSLQLERRSVIDGVLEDMDAPRGRLDGTEQTRLDLHLEQLREVERRLADMELEDPDRPPPSSSCSSPVLDDDGHDAARVYDPALFPDLMRMQIDVMVQAMACGQTRVGVIQGSYHTSELIMSRFVRPSDQSPDYDMRSHQASHYGPHHDRGRPEFANFVLQRRWFLEQFAYLLERLDGIPEGEGTMLDYSTVLLCTEVCDGNTHTHSDMPFVLAGRGAGALRGGQLIDAGGRRHGDLLAAIGQSMGADFQSFGDSSSEALPGVLS